MTASPATFPDWLGHQAASRGSALALVADGRQWTFAELDRDVDRLAHALAARGVVGGERVATLLHNGAAPVIVVHALLRLGATLVPLNTRLGAAEQSWQLAHAAPRLVLAEPRTAAQAHAATRVSADDATPSRGAVPLHVLADEWMEAPSITVPLRRVHPADHVLAVIYTSGTTGRPKGAMLTVANFWWSAIGSAMNLGIGTDDRWLACLPLFHVGGLSVVLRSAIYGTTIVVHDGFDADVVNEAIDANGVTIASFVSVMLRRLLDARGERRFPASLRCVLLGGGPAPRALLERGAALGAPIVQTYGLTETASQVATLAPADALRHVGSAGRPLYPNLVRIVPADGRESGDDDAGEIQVRGPIVMAGYLDDHEATARALSDGWLRTGDVGRIDADGLLYVLDRRDDLIITGGENVYPAEVEAALLAHPAVVEAGVVGAGDPEWGQRVVAFVRLAAGEAADGTAIATGDVTPESLRAWCRTRLAGYKAPSEVRVAADPLPRTASGKLRRSALRALLRGDAPPGVSA